MFSFLFSKDCILQKKQFPNIMEDYNVVVQAVCIGNGDMWKVFDIKALSHG
jgi:hypothetical protein